MDIPKLEKQDNEFAGYAIYGYKKNKLTKAQAAEVIRRAEAYKEGFFLDDITATKARLICKYYQHKREQNNDKRKWLDIATKDVLQALGNDTPALAAAKKCAKTGSRKDLKNYLKERKNER